MKKFLSYLHGRKTYLVCLTGIGALGLSYKAGFVAIGTLVVSFFAFLVFMTLRHALSSAISRIENMAHKIHVKYEHDRSASRFL